jgi:hypothetical protein
MSMLNFYINRAGKNGPSHIGFRQRKYAKYAALTNRVRRLKIRKWLLSPLDSSTIRFRARHDPSRQAGPGRLGCDT